MYLLTFTFLVIAALGMYTQVLAVETARMFQHQKGLAQAMIYWDEAALSLANNVINPYPTLAAGGCSLTPGFAGPGFCQSGGTVAPPNANTTVTGGYTVGGVTYPYIPTGYAGGTYPWKSIAFQNNGIYYVVTYVDPPAAGGFISTAATQLSVTQSDLYKQIQNTGLSNMAYGYVSTVGPNQMLITTAIINGLPVQYLVPFVITSGSLGIISSTTPCGSC